MRRHKGFTIVELLIVIVIIAILASITVVAYNGIQTRAKNSARASQISQITRLLEIYKAQNGTYPSGLANSTQYCVGIGYPNGKCRDYTSTSPSVFALDSDTSVSSKLATAGTIPNGNYYPSNGTVGPYLYTWTDGSGFTLVAVVDGETGQDCPAGMYADWNDPSSTRLLCMKDYTY